MPTEENITLLSTELNKFLDHVGKTIKENGLGTPTRLYHSFDGNESLKELIPSKELKWGVGRTVSRKLMIYDDALLNVIKEHEIYDFQGMNFYCYSEDGKLHFEVSLPHDENSLYYQSTSGILKVGRIMK